MAGHTKQKKDNKAMLVRIISLVLAVLMILSVILASVWQW